MKILVLSLLRLGDLILHRELAKSLKRQYPQAEIQFLIHSQFASANSLIPEVTRWHLFPRKKIQQILVERQQSPLAAYLELENLIDKLNGEKFDLILNATHNRMSVRLMDLLHAREKRGVALQDGKKVFEKNPWLNYFNENFSAPGCSRFHYLEVLHRALGLEFAVPGRAAEKGDGIIFLQLLTSDKKKNWGLEKFHSLLCQLRRLYPQVYGLCSPGEREAVLKVFSADEVFSPPLPEAAEMLAKARLLITGDTSLLHLATQKECPVVALFLGSADPVKTGPWQQEAVIIHGAAPCSPCSHTLPACPQTTHLCAESIGVESALQIIQAVLQGRQRELKSPVVRKTQIRHSHVSLDQAIGDLLEQTIWADYLEGAHRDQVPAFATRARELSSEWGERLSAEQVSRWLERQRQLEDFQKFQENQLKDLASTMTVGFEAAIKNNGSEAICRRSLQEIYRIFLQFPELKDSILRLENGLKEFQQNSFIAFKMIRAGWEEWKSLQEIRAGIIREFKNLRSAKEVSSERI